MNYDIEDAEDLRPFASGDSRKEEVVVDHTTYVEEPEVLVNLIKVVIRDKSLILQFHPILCR